MQGHDMTVSQMYWQPPLLKLTYVPNPEVDDGQPTTCFVCPQSITAIGRQKTQFFKVEEAGARHPPVTCTAVIVSASMVFYVTESPEEIARLRDKAMGHEQKPELRTVS